MDELEKIQQQIEELQKKAHELQQQKKSAIIEEVKAKIKAYGLTAKDLGLFELSSVQPAPMKKPVAIKYRLNQDTWTGRGRKPKWLEVYLANGGKLEDIAV